MIFKKEWVWGFVLAAAFSGAFSSCNKNKVSEEALYPKAPATLVKFEDASPTPALVAESAIVTVKVNGLEGKKGQFRFYINQVEAEVMNVTAEEVSVKIPITASTGSCAVEIGGEFYFGPVISIRGKLNIDPSFNTGSSIATGGPMRGEISGILRRANGGLFIYGSFADYQSTATSTTAVNGIAVIDENGAAPASEANRLKTGVQGLGGGASVNTAFEGEGGTLYIAGSFATMNEQGPLNNVAMLRSDGALDTALFDITGEGEQPQKYGPVFHGGVGGNVLKLFNTASGIIAVGNFTSHASILFERSTRETPYIDRVQISQVVRMKEDGVIDSSFNLNKAMRPVQGYTNANGLIYDAVQTANGKLLLAGSFTTFENQGAGRIIRIDTATGRRDPSFTAGGANGSINRITYNQKTGKILLTGGFTTYNGQPANGVVMIDQDGNVDNSFKFRTVEEGIPNYAGQLDDGKILVSGTFNKYAGVVRPGFMVLNPDGTLAVGYNNLGFCNGYINGFTEYPSATDPTIRFVMMVGSFTRFDGKQVGNIVKLRFQN
ncbi:DUF5008 domain-containing protein [Niabella beijingensis]|uniref:DUF5008 domain-containing protein n=1 Tax=Niabella beijingensis TaxID=2872700 RepID=UPI001CBF75D1|nr:DUF5008 domain-containing protein [Niabella beijingensis]MBZ4189076.1 DUF5008 domain-containing protein [Niabella beijingensis]